jgi:hypothetical protein
MVTLILFQFTINNPGTVTIVYYIQSFIEMSKFNILLNCRWYVAVPNLSSRNVLSPLMEE